MELTAQEERETEQVCRQENLYLLRQCLADARNIMKDEKLMDMQNHTIQMAIALFEKRAENIAEHKQQKIQQKIQRKVREETEKEEGAWGI